MSVAQPSSGPNTYERGRETVKQKNKISVPKVVYERIKHTNSDVRGKLMLATVLTAGSAMAGAVGYSLSGNQKQSLAANESNSTPVSRSTDGTEILSNSAVPETKNSDVEPPPEHFVATEVEDEAEAILDEYVVSESQKSAGEESDKRVLITLSGGKQTVNLDEYIEELAEENPMIHDETAVRLYLDSADGIRPGETVEEMEARNKIEYVWGEWLSSRTDDIENNSEYTEFMLFRSRNAVTTTRNGEEVTGILLIGIGVNPQLYSTKYEGLTYARTLGIAQDAEELEEINENFVREVVNKHK